MTGVAAVLDTLANFMETVRRIGNAILDFLGTARRLYCAIGAVAISIAVTFFGVVIRGVNELIGAFAALPADVAAVEAATASDHSFVLSTTSAVLQFANCIIPFNVMVTLGIALMALKVGAMAYRFAKNWLENGW